MANLRASPDWAKDTSWLFSSKRLGLVTQSGQSSSPGTVPFVGWSNAGTLTMTMTNSCVRLEGDTKLVRMLSPLVCPEIPPVASEYWSASSLGGLSVKLSKIGQFFFVVTASISCHFSNQEGETVSDRPVRCIVCHTSNSISWTRITETPKPLSSPR